MRIPKTKPLDRRGITLVETIVASLIMVIGTLVLSTGFIAAARMMTVSSADQKTARLVTTMMNGGVRGGVNGEGNALVGFEFTVDGFKFAPKVKKFKFSDYRNESIVFYRLELEQTS